MADTNKTKRKRQDTYRDEDDDDDLQSSKSMSILLCRFFFDFLTSELEKGRKERSLLVLTQMFKDLIDQSEDGIIELNEAAKTLNVQKRRIYDITNVLEGVELVRKFSKNKIQWNDHTSSFVAENREDDDRRLSELRQLKSDEEAIDLEIRQFEAMVNECENSKYAYITHEDIRKLPECIDHTIIAIKAPKGTKLEVPDPDSAGDGSKLYQIFLQNDEQKAINVYLLSQLDSGMEMPSYGVTESFAQGNDDYGYLDMYNMVEN